MAKKQAKGGAAVANGSDRDGKRVVAAEISADEDRQIEAIKSRTGRKRSDILRRAVRIMLRDDEAGKIDWGKAE